MKSPSQTRTTTTNPLTLTSSILPELLSINAESPVLDIARTNPSSQSEAVEQRKRLRMILESAIAVLDGADDFDASMDSSTTHHYRR
jgi:hypothetical protein